MYSKLNYAVTVLLIVLYCACGVTGQSVSYLLELASSSRICESERPQQLSTSKAHGYFHHHGPGSHFHYHATAGTSSPTPEDASSDKGDTRRERLAGPENYHTEHACPLLSVLRLLEQGTGAQLCLEPKPDLTSAVSPHELAEFVFLEASAHLARGPPRSLCA